MIGPMQKAMTDNDHHFQLLALAAFEQLHTAMLGVVDMFTHESQVTTALLGVLAQRTPITTLVGNFDITSERAGVTAALDGYETARRHARVALWRVMLAEGCSIGEISRIFGLSRQLVSRQLRDIP